MEGGAARHEASHQLTASLRAAAAAATAYNHFTCPIFLRLHTSILSREPDQVHLPEPLRPSEQAAMEAKKKSPPATAAAAGAGAAPPVANGYFSNYFTAPPAGNAKDAKSADLYAMLNKQSSRGQNGSGIAGGKSQGRTTYKDGKHVYHNESSESPYFGSSVHYGGRDFYDSAPQKQSFEPPRNYNEDGADGSATRGDWWQGSLYY